MDLPGFFAYEADEASAHITACAASMPDTYISTEFLVFRYNRRFSPACLHLKHCWILQPNHELASYWDIIKRDNPCKVRNRPSHYI